MFHRHLANLRKIESLDLFNGNNKPPSSDLRQSQRQQQEENHSITALTSFKKKKKKKNDNSSSIVATTSKETAMVEVVDSVTKCKNLCILDETIDEENIEKSKNVIKKIFGMITPMNLPNSVVYYISSGSKHNCGMIHIHFIGQRDSIPLNILNHLDAKLRIKLGDYYALQPHVVPCFQREMGKEEITNPVEFSLFFGIYTHKYIVHRNISNPLIPSPSLSLSSTEDGGDGGGLMHEIVDETYGVFSSLHHPRKRRRISRD